MGDDAERTFIAENGDKVEVVGNIYENPDLLKPTS